MAPNLFGNTLLLAEQSVNKADPNSSSESTLNSSAGEPDAELRQRNGTVDQASSEHDPSVVATDSDAKPLRKTYKKHYVWRNIIVFLYLHIGTLYGFYLLATGQAKMSTFFLAMGMALSAAYGITAGAHRLWSHKSYKARLPLRIFLMLLQTVAFQNSIFEWVRDHRVHHKFTDTDADPHNASRGFFFSHMGWLLIRKHPDVKEKGKTIDMSDLEQDGVVMFQQKYFLVMMPFMSFILPALLPYYLLGETFSNSWYIASVLRYIISVHFTWLVNSAAHIWGMKPYDINIKPTNNLMVAILAMGEGWHNYHHVFPWDYKTSEFSRYRTNFTTAFIDFFSKIGWAYDLKTVSQDVIGKRVLRTGDLSNGREEQIRRLLLEGHDNQANDNNNSNGHNNYKDSQMIWGWDDTDMSEVDKSFVEILNKQRQK